MGRCGGRRGFDGERSNHRDCICSVMAGAVTEKVMLTVQLAIGVDWYES